MVADAPSARLRRARRNRRDYVALSALITTPGSLAAPGVTLPANAELYASYSLTVADATALLTINGVNHGIPAVALNTTCRIGRFEKGVKVAKATGPAGTVTLYARDGLGVLRKIAEG